MSSNSSSKLVDDGGGQASEPSGRRIVVPTVSVASLDEHGNWTTRSGELEPRSRPGGNSSAGSTTSEVNSLDGAESIASRLSQIVDEQAFIMQQLAARPETRPNTSRTTSNVVMEQDGEQQHRLRTSSFAAGQQRGLKLAAAEAKQAKRRNESSNCLFPMDQIQPKGNSRALGNKRAAADQCEPDSHRQGANNELMLNIRRSAWKLDEFEQAFRQSDSDSDESANEPADSVDCDTFRRQRSNSSSGSKSLLARASRRLTLNTSPSAAVGSPSLLAQSERRLSHSDSTITQVAGAADGSQKNNNQSTKSDHLRDNLLCAGPRTQHELKRRGSNISTVSFASSAGSNRSRRRPFPPLANNLLLDKTNHSSAPDKRAGRVRHTSEHSQSQGSSAARAECLTMDRLRQFVPLLEWLPAYAWRRDFGADLMAGMVVATINISTSLSAAVVAQTELGVAFRSSIFNAFVYSLLCTSRHNSFGSWSMMSQMLLDSVRRALGDQLVLSRIHLGPQADWSLEQYEMWHMNIIIMYTFLIGLIQLLAGALNLGNILASFIPEALCSSMIAATAFTMAVGQLANMCGTSNKLLWALERHNSTTELSWADLKPRERVNIADLFSDLFRWFHQVALLLRHSKQVNLVACAISLTTVILLVLNQGYIQPRLRAWLKRDVFVPFEMLLMIGWISLSYWLELRDNYKVTTCDAITIQFDLPQVPNLRLVRELWLDSLATALISFTMVFIMAKTYSNKFNYEVNNNQELIACGAGNLIGGLFDALPATASISRTAAQVEAGGRTQMASLINCAVLVGLVQGLGQHVAHLPVCVMAAILFFGFVRMMARAREALDYWRICRVDFAIWLVTFAAILTFDLVTGFLYGFTFSLLSMLYRAQIRRCHLLGSIGNSDVYVPLSKYPLARELNGIKIFQFCGPIHYSCADLFEKRLRQKTRVNVKAQLTQHHQQQREHTKCVRISNISHSVELGDGAKHTKTDQFNPKNMNLPSHIILDFSMISFLDTAGVRVVKKIIADYQRLNITIMVASLASHVAKTVKSDPELWNNHKDRFYLTLADAVHHALRDNKLASCQLHLGELQAKD